jgi:hypothetical protein
MGVQPSTIKKIALENKKWKWFHAAIGRWFTSRGTSILGQTFNIEPW